MSTRILGGGDDGDRQAALYDSVSGWAFGPVFDSYADAEAFLEWMARSSYDDPRAYPDHRLEALYGAWRDQRGSSSVGS